MSATAPLLEIVGLHKAFGASTVLRGIDLRVRRGELVCVIGPSGSGKSTMLRCCNRLEEPSAGQIVLDGQDITRPDTDLNQVRQRIGMVFQQFNLYPHLDALGNVALALQRVQKLPKAQARTQALAALARRGPGRQGRVAAVRTVGAGSSNAWASPVRSPLQPLVMLFDEPTSALDPELVGSVLQVMHELRRDGMTMLVVTHEMGFAQDAADRVVFMADGVVLEQGPPAQVFGAPQHERTRAFVARHRGMAHAG